MRTYRSRGGPFAERPYYKTEEIESLCTDELRKFDLYPENPEAIRIERFIEKRFKITPEYDELPEGVLGFTRFGKKGVEGIVVARILAEDGGKVSERRINTTLAHEAGHGLLHAHLFVAQDTAAGLFGSDFDHKAPKILCRDVIAVQGKQLSTYGGRWWEFQANQIIGAILLPRELVRKCIAPFFATTGTFGIPQLKPGNTEKMVALLSETFNVNPAVARIRVEQLFPEKDAGQLTL